MKKSATIRSIVAMMVIIFAVAATSCSKESEITPTAPAIPTTPVTPAISTKPLFIATTENGITIRKETYEYDTQGKLLKYETLSPSGASDSVLIRNNSVAFKTPGSTSINQSLVFNPDKTFKSLFTANDQTDFVNIGNNLQRAQRIRVNNTPQGVAEFLYANNNITALGAEIRVDISYYNNLPYQKGINEIPIVFKPIKFYKTMEMDDVTSTVLYNKLIKQIIMNFGGGRFETHEYAYGFDTNNRVKEIKDTITFSTSSSSTQKIRSSVITY